MHRTRASDGVWFSDEWLNEGQEFESPLADRSVPHLTIAIGYCDIAVVKTVTKSISLHEDLAKFANKKADAGGYGNVSAYFAELLRKERQAEIDADVKFLEHSMKDAPLDPPIAKIVAACKATRRQMQREKWGKSKAKK